MRARIRFEKQGSLIYVGHLDLMRYFQKAVKRSGIEIRYSEGFNPHQIMSFAAPLGVGIESFGEYIDIDILKEISCEEAIQKLNENMVEGLKITSFKYLNDTDEKCMSCFCAASYKIEDRDNNSYYGFDINNSKTINSLIDNFMSSESIVITKETKKATRELDLKPLIYDFKFKDNAFFMTVSSGSVDNIKPELVLETFYNSINKNIFDMAITRLDMYTSNEAGLVSLSEVGYVR